MFKMESKYSVGIRKQSGCAWRGLTDFLWHKWQGILDSSKVGYLGVPGTRDEAWVAPRASWC